MKKIQPLTYVEGHWILEGSSGYDRRRDSNAANALIRATDFLRGQGYEFESVLILPNPEDVNHPNFALILTRTKSATF